MNRETIEIAQKNFERKKRNRKLYESLQFLHDAELEEIVLDADGMTEEEVEQDFLHNHFTELDLIIEYTLGFFTGCLITGMLIYMGMCM